MEPNTAHIKDQLVNDSLQQSETHNNLSAPPVYDPQTMQPVSAKVIINNKRRRPSDKHNRRFIVNKDAPAKATSVKDPAVKDSISAKPSKKKDAIPSPVAFMPRKVRTVRRGLRYMVFVAVVFITLSTVSLWRRHALLSHLPADIGVGGAPRNSATSAAFLSGTDAASTSAEARHNVGRGDGVHNDTADIESDSGREGGPVSAPGVKSEVGDGLDDNVLPALDQGAREQGVLDEGRARAEDTHHSGQNDMQADSEHHADGEGRADSDDKLSGSEKHAEQAPSGGDEGSDHVAPVSFEDLPERIEWYNRDDFKDGTRPMCRITRPYILSNGTLLIPDWMNIHQRLLRRCGLSHYDFYPTNGSPEGLGREETADVDFVLTVRLEKFQEPTHDPSVYLTEHILKASYLFDVFSGNAREVGAVKEHYCYTAANDSVCTLPRPPRTGLKPGLFVPKKIETGSKNSWSYQTVEMFGTAHGLGDGVAHLNTSAFLDPSHAGRTENLTGTRLRSVMVMDGMFRHLPAHGLKHSSLYSRKNGIKKTPKEFTKDGKCAMSIAISSSSDIDQGVQGAAELQTKLNVLLKFAIPNSEIDVTLLEVSPSMSLVDVAQKMQAVDLFIAGSGPTLNTMTFMRQSSTVLEIMPFGIAPNTHENLAKILGYSYASMKAKPQTEQFKRCVDGEVFHLRKKGEISFSQSPDWYEPLMKAWDGAVAELALSGKASLDVLTAEVPVRNYHSRVCALRQMVEVESDSAARQVIHTAKAKCEGKGIGEE